MLKEICDIIWMVQNQFRENELLSFGISTNLKNSLSGLTIVEYSNILVEDMGMLYYDPNRKTCFYHGGVNGQDFYILEHFPIKKDFKSLMPYHLEEQLVTVFDQKTSKTIIYTQEIENQLFKFY